MVHTCDVIRTVAVSGGFDPLHGGHIRLINDAAEYGQRVIVFLNNDNWLMKKKGFVFMPEEERKVILEALFNVHEVYITEHSEDDEDTSVCNMLRKYRPTVFANGGDRKIDNIPEYELCLQLGIEMVFNVGGEKTNSSSELVKKVQK